MGFKQRSPDSVIYIKFSSRKKWKRFYLEEQIIFFVMQNEFNICKVSFIYKETLQIDTFYRTARCNLALNRKGLVGTRIATEK